MFADVKVNELDTVVQSLNTRMSVMENSLHSFQGCMDSHKTEEAGAFEAVQKSFDEVLRHIDDARREHKAYISEMKAEILSRMDEKYMPSIKVNEKITEVRRSILLDIVKESKRATHQFWLIWSGLSLGLAMSGWIYMHILKG